MRNSRLGGDERLVGEGQGLRAASCDRASRWRRRGISHVLAIPGSHSAQFAGSRPVDVAYENAVSVHRMPTTSWSGCSLRTSAVQRRPYWCRSFGGTNAWAGRRGSGTRVSRAIAAE